VSLFRRSFLVPVIAAAIVVAAFSTASATDTVGAVLSPQTATASGSDNSRISVSTGGLSADATASGTTSYVNSNSDATVIGDYLKGYYYDSMLGFFRLDWSANPSNNVRFVASSTKCASGYGYQLGGYAYGAYGGIINFGYSSNINVYYCQSDNKLHGYAYSSDTGFQNFEGVGFSLLGGGAVMGAGFSTGSSDPFFANNSTILLSETPSSITNIQGEKTSSEIGSEVIFYIVK
jgi:hypothetical protein